MIINERSYEDEFSNDIVKSAWKRAHGRCEKCKKDLVWDNRDKDGQRGAWNAHHIIPVADGGWPVLSNCQILCLNCHKKKHQDDQ